MIKTNGGQKYISNFYLQKKNCTKNKFAIIIVIFVDFIFFCFKEKNMLIIIKNYFILTCSEFIDVKMN